MIDISTVFQELRAALRNHMTAKGNLTDIGASAGALYRQWRESKGMSLRDAAKKMGISPAYLSDLERGSRRRSEKLIEKAEGL